MVIRAKRIMARVALPSAPLCPDDAWQRNAMQGDLTSLHRTVSVATVEMPLRRPG